jgi:hypothetical protein
MVRIGWIMSDIIAIAANFFLIGICVGAQWYLEWWGWVVIISVLFVTGQVWGRLTKDLAAVHAYQQEPRT